MISQLKPANVKVLSLTTIATPHRGISHTLSPAMRLSLTHPLRLLLCRRHVLLDRPFVLPLPSLNSHLPPKLTQPFSHSNQHTKTLHHARILRLRNRRLFPTDPILHVANLQPKNTRPRRHILLFLRRQRKPSLLEYVPPISQDHSEIRGGK